MHGCKAYYVKVPGLHLAHWKLSSSLDVNNSWVLLVLIWYMLLYMWLETSNKYTPQTKYCTDNKLSK